MYPLVLFHGTLLTKCFIQRSLLQRKELNNTTIFKEVENIIKSDLYISYTSITSQDTCSLSDSIKRYECSMIMAC